MKKIISCILLLCMFVTVLASCGGEDVTYNLESAKQYIVAMYEGDSTRTDTDYTLITVVPGTNDVKYTVAWSVAIKDGDPAAVKVGAVDDAAKTVVIDVNERATADTNYTLTATITAPDGTSTTASFNRMVPKYSDPIEILNVAYALKENETTPDAYTLTGKIIGITAYYDAGYNNISVMIQVGDYADKPIQCYRLKGTGADGLKYGDTITVKGKFTNYKGKIQYEAGCELLSVSAGPALPTAPTDAKSILDAAYALKDGEYSAIQYTLTGMVVEINTPYDANYGNMCLTIKAEGDDRTMYCYRLTGDECQNIALGDTITVTGYFTAYKGKPQFIEKTPLVSRVAGEGYTPPENNEPAADAPLADIFAYANTLADGSQTTTVYTFTGTVTEIDGEGYSEQYKNITFTMLIDGSEQSLLVYRAKGTPAATLAVGDKITVAGVFKNYGGTIELVNGSLSDPDDTTVTLPEPDPATATPAEIVAYANSLKPGANSTKEFTLSGKVTEITEAYTEQYKNVSFKILVDGTESTMLIFRVKAEGIENLKVGDTVSVKGIFKNYAGTIELADCTLLSLTAGEGGNQGGTDPEPPVTNEPAADAAIADILAYANAMATDTQTTTEYTLSGRVTEITEAYTEQYKNVSFNILVDGTESTMLIFRVKAEGIENLKVGDTVSVKGIFKNYKGTIELANCTLLSLTAGEGGNQGGTDPEPPATNEPDPATATPAEIVAYAYTLASGATTTNTYTLTGVIIALTEYSEKYGNATFTMVIGDDKAHPIQAYQAAGDNIDQLKPGYTVTVSGKLTNYNNGSFQFVKGSTVTSFVAGELPSDGSAAAISFADKALRTECDKEKQVWVSNGITVTNEKASSTSDVADYAAPARFYKNSSLTIAYTANMTKIVVVCASATYASNLAASVTEGATATVEGATVTITLTTPAASFTIAPLGAQIRVSDIKVYTA